MHRMQGVRSKPGRASLWRYGGRCTAKAIACVVVSLAGLPSQRATAQETLPDFSVEWRWADFGAEAGLPRADVRALVELDGTPWVGTDAGVAYYDGFLWHHLGPAAGLPQAPVTSLAPEEGGTLLVVIAGSIFRGDQRGFSEVSTGLPPESEVLRAAPTGRGRFFATARVPSENLDAPRLFHIDADTAQAVSLPAPVAGSGGLWLARSGRLWVDTQQGLCVRAGGAWRLAEDQPPKNRGTSVLTEGRSGEGIAFRSRPDSEIGVLDWTATRPISRLKEGGRNALLAADIAAGLTVAVYETGDLRVKEGGRWRSFTLPVGRSNGLHFVHLADNGDVWFASRAGLHRYRRTMTRWSSAPRMFPDDRNRINALMVARDSSIWLGTTGGLLVHRRDGSIRWFETIEGHPMVVTGITEDSTGSVWVSNGQDLEGVFRWDGRTWQGFGPEDGLDAGRVHRVFTDHLGQVWFMSLGSMTREGAGVHRLADGEVENLTRSMGLPAGAAFAMAEHTDGTIWLALETGLVRIRGDDVSVWTVAEGLRERGGRPLAVFDVVVGPEGRAWFSHRPDLEAGLAFVDEHDSIHYVDPPGGRRGHRVWGLKSDKRGVLWVGSDAGLARYEDGVWAHLDSGMGLGAESVWPIEEYGRSLLVGTRGSSSVTLDREEEDDPAPRVILDPPVVDGRVGHFAWSALSFQGAVPTARILTRSRLDGGPWSEWTHDRDLVRGGLRPGGHTFDVQAKGLFGQVTAPPARAEFRVPLPLVLRPAYALPMSLLLTIVLALAVLARRRRELHEAALRESEGKWRALVETAPAAIAIFDPSLRRFVLVNENATALLGYSKEEILGSDPGLLSPEQLPDGRDSRAVLRQAIEQAMSGVPYVTEWEAVSKGGERIPCEVRLNRLPGADAGLLRVSLMDLRERLEAEEHRKELEGQLMQAVKLEAVGKLTGGISHDFNNLLTVVRGSLELLLAEEGLSDDVRALARDALKAAERGGELTKSLLAFSRTQSLAHVPLDVASLLDDVGSILRRTLSEEITFETRVPDDAWRLIADRTELESALINLAVNARDAMPDGGRLAIDVGNVLLSHEDLVSLGAGAPERPGEYGRIRVMDSGVGMDEDILARALDPFFTTKPVGRGSGLGLSQVYGFVTQLGGGIHIESAVGEGTIITLYLPRAHPASPETEDGVSPVLSPRREPGNGETILVVDDDRGVRHLLQKLLKRLGYGVHAVGSADAALSFLGNGRRPRVVLTDMNLGLGMDGLELARRVRAAHPEMPIIVSSGRAPEELLDSLTTEGLFLLPKPFDHEEIVAVVARALGGPPAA